MRHSLLVNNMYAAYTATSSHLSSKSISELSKLVRRQQGVGGDIEHEEYCDITMDKVIVSDAILSVLKAI